MTDHASTLVIIPAFNEEDALPGTLAELMSVRPDLDVVVVSDGSIDKTAALARAAGVASSSCRSTSASAARCRPASATRCAHGYDPRRPVRRRRPARPARDRRRSKPRSTTAPSLVIGSRFGEGTVEYRVGPVRRAAMRVLAWSVNRMSRAEVHRHVVGVPGVQRAACSSSSPVVPGRVHGLHRVAAPRVQRRIPGRRGADPHPGARRRDRRRPATCGSCITTCGCSS